MPEFVSKVQSIVESRTSKIVLLLSPVIEQMPLPIQRYDEPLLPFGKAMIDATRDVVCGYAFDLEAYLVPGAAGIIALERTINYVPDHVITILHGTFFTPSATSIMSKTGLNVDAVTVGRVDLIGQQSAELQSRLLLVGEQAAEYGRFSVEQWSVTVLDEGEAIQLQLVSYQDLDSSQGLDFAESAREALLALAEQS
jgi:hypothetical protein